ncbi:hypothetical protein [Dyadobacter luticola]|uniref:Lipoprotein n=1 Tax=Dyadobacter luticola TaxID=1979387 RepID=A0A5R9L3X6_9BACT|nr:hypothetical protein [Dyadobacter luticola]TLV03253.1 hypothetical protein FEN17_06485 [Dyadobacter luticola]
MKSRNILFAFCLFVSLVACRESDNISIKVVDDDHIYRYNATFPRSRSRDVERYINNRISPSSISYDNAVDVTTTLDDNTKFDYEASPGKLEIELDKRQNSLASYQRIKKMCKGLDQVINPKK